LEEAENPSFESIYKTSFKFDQQHEVISNNEYWDFRKHLQLIYLVNISKSLFFEFLTLIYI
jgi:hypothetical protein